MKRTYETIVLGCGWIGAAALYWLARRAGSEVLGIEQFALFHHNGGSQDQSRIPQFTPQGEVDVLYQAQDGYGATVLEHCPAAALIPTADEVTVVTAQGDFTLSVIVKAVLNRSKGA